MGHATTDPRERRAAMVLLLYAGFRAATFLRTAWPFDTDDAFITLRYSRHLASGLGILWNVGDPLPVEGYSNFSFVLVGAAAIKLGLDPILVFKALGVAGIAGTAAIVYVLAREWVGPIAATIPVVVLTSYRGEAWWGVSGLETTAYQFLVAAAVLSFFRWRRGPDQLRLQVATGMLCFLAALTRPEAPLVFAVMLAALLLEESSRGLRGVAAFTLSFGVPFAAYLAWRLGYYGHLLPNSASCKAGYAEDPTKLLRDFWIWAWPLGALALARRRSDATDPRTVVLIAIPVVYTAVLYRVDPIIGHQSRHFLAAFALLAVAAAAGAAQIATWAAPRAPRIWREVALAAITVVVAAEWSKNNQALLYRDATLYAARMETRRNLAEWLNDRAGPQQWVAIGDAGLVPYLARANVADLFCLNDARATASPAARDPQRVADTVLERPSDIIVLASNSGTELSPFRLYNVQPTLVADPRFAAQYELAARFGASFEEIKYWVFVRRREVPIVERNE